MEDSTSNKGSKGLQGWKDDENISFYLYNISVDEKENRQQPRTERERNTPGDPIFEWQSFIDKGGFLSISCCYNLFIPPRSFPPFVPEWPRRRGRLWGINKDGCWQIKVTRRDGGLLNIQFTSHKSAAASRWLETATLYDEQLNPCTNVPEREMRDGAEIITHMVLWQTDPG